MEENSKLLWSNFKNEFVSQLTIFDSSELRKEWLFRQYRTQFYKGIYPTIAARLGLENMPGEFLRVDNTMCIKDNKTNWEIPVIFIESENNFDTAEEEIYKLCSLSAPLRVLITFENNSDIDGWINNWASYIETSFRIWSSMGILGIIIANYEFKFYSIVWDCGYWHDKEVLYANDSK